MSSANCSEFLIFYVNGMQIPQIRFFTPNFIFTLCIFCIKTFFKKKFFCEHFLDTLCYYNTRKPPNTLYSFLLHPIRNKKYLLREKTSRTLTGLFVSLNILWTFRFSRNYQSVTSYRKEIGFTHLHKKFPKISWFLWTLFMKPMLL